MFRVIKDQLSALGLLAKNKFVEDMVEHLYAFTPEHAKSLGPKALQNIVDMGIQRARKHGFTQRGPVQFYIELMFLLGSDFDTDPQLRWASNTLNKPWDRDYQLRRATELFQHASYYLNAVAGPGNQYVFDTLRRTISGGFDFVPDSASNIVEELLQKLRYLAPEKYTFVGQDPLKVLIQHGLSAARSYNAQTVFDQKLIVLLMFEFGHGCLTDPQLPWIELTLRRQASLQSQSVFENLRRKVQIYAEDQLNNASKQHGRQRYR